MYYNRYVMLMSRKRGEAVSSPKLVYSMPVSKTVEIQAAFEIVNRQKSKIQIYNSQRKNNSFFFIWNIKHSWLNT